jgi:hypothetical protein
MDNGRKPILPNGSPVKQAVASAESSRFTKAELLESTGATAGMLQGAVSAGLVQAKNVYSGQDMIVMTSIVEAAVFGLEPRHLRGMRLAVDREVGLISQAVSASNGGKISPVALREKGRELSEILTTLRAVLTKDALERLES